MYNIISYLFESNHHSSSLAQVKHNIKHKEILVFTTNQVTVVDSEFCHLAAYNTS